MTGWLTLIEMVGPTLLALACVPFVAVAVMVALERRR